MLALRAVPASRRARPPSAPRPGAPAAIGAGSGRSGPTVARQTRGAPLIRVPDGTVPNGPVGHRGCARNRTVTFSRQRPSTARPERFADRAWRGSAGYRSGGGVASRAPSTGALPTWWGAVRRAARHRGGGWPGRSAAAFGTGADAGGGWHDGAGVPGRRPRPRTASHAVRGYGRGRPYRRRRPHAAGRSARTGERRHHRPRPPVVGGPSFLSG
ncbi:hypothetical protein GCM10010393_16660 [Streptomyces gobitricini]|uniref:Uncharacterized protein n=1 Tax=Streptomyces gobitricini TaxID=68211 RepID=A0ABP5YSC7_9ACTN